MNKSAISALLLALIVPLTAYFIMKSLSGRAIHMPPRFYADTVITNTVKGKLETDTVWHQLPPIRMVNQLGDTVGWNNMMKDSVNGKIIVANFFFTHCPTICSALTSNMRLLQETLKKSEKVGDRTADYVQLLSFSVDPERDSVVALKHWADRFQVNPANWWLLTGSKKEIYDLSINDMKLGLVDGEGVDTSFIHTDRFVLIDRDRVIRGYYHGLDSMSISKLAKDVIILSLEKDRKKKSFFADKIETLAIIFLIALVALGIFLIFLRRVRKNESA